MSNYVGMGELDEHILERRSTLGQFAYGPMSINGQAKNFLSHVSA